MTGSIPPRTRAFTLVELLISVTILSLLIVLLSSLVSGVNKAWIAGERQTETFQDGRAILDLISRELSQASISRKLQLIQNPALPAGVNVRTEADSLFWQAPLTSTTKGNLGEVGYVLNNTYQLKRFFVPPDNAKYAIFVNSPTSSDAPWLTTPFASQTEFDAMTSVVADGILALWVRCLDANGAAVPWFSTHCPEAPAATKIRFNSAARFQPAIPSQAPPAGETNWPYTASTTMQANRLPTAIEITLVTLDAKTLDRSRASIPAIPPSTDETQIPAAITAFNAALVTAHIQSARTFSTRVKLANARD